MVGDPFADVEDTDTDSALVELGDATTRFNAVLVQCSAAGSIADLNPQAAPALIDVIDNETRDASNDLHLDTQPCSSETAAG